MSSVWDTRKPCICPHRFFTLSFWNHSEKHPELLPWQEVCPGPSYSDILTCSFLGFLQAPPPSPCTLQEKRDTDWTTFTFLALTLFLFPGEITTIYISWLLLLIRNSVTNHCYFTLESMTVFWHWFFLHFYVLIYYNSLSIKNTNWYK